MFFLALSAPSLLSGCVVDCPDCVTKAELDDAVAAALVERGCITGAEGDARYLTSEDAAATYLTSAAAAETYLTTAEAAATYLEASELTGLGDRVTALEGTVQDAGIGNAALDDRIAAIEDGYATEEEVDGAISLNNTNYDDRATSAGLYASVTDFDALSDEAVRVMTTDTTWAVTNEAEMLDALANLDNYHIASEATLTIQVAAGDYYFTNSLTVHHPDGGRVRIEGETGSPADVHLYFTGSSGVVVDEGSALGYVGAVTLHGDGVTDAQGFWVTGSSAAAIGPLTIDDFGGDGLEVSGASALVAGMGDLAVTDSGQTGIRISENSAAYLPSFQVAHSVPFSGAYGALVDRGGYLYGAGAAVSGSGGSGFYVDGGASVDIANAASSGNGHHGVYVSGGSSLVGTSADATSNALSGFYVTDGSQAYLDSATATGNGDYGFASESLSWVNASSATSAGNQVAFESDAGWLWAPYSNASGSTEYDYVQRYNGLIYAYDVVGGTNPLSANNLVDDWMFGL